MPIVHKLAELYKGVYQIGKKLNKGDKLGIWAKVEDNLLGGLESAISASLLPVSAKSSIIRQLALKIELVKRLIRLTYEIKIIEATVYLRFAEQLEEISRMAAGWRKYINKKSQPPADS